MDTTRIFEQSELTKLMVLALNEAQKSTEIELSDWKKCKELLDRIISEKMDIKLIHREE